MILFGASIQLYAVVSGEMKRFALRELSTVMNEGDKNISRLGAMLKMLAISIDQIEHKIVHDRENRTNLANAVDTRADDVDQLGGSSVKMEDLAEHLPRAITAAVLSSGERLSRMSPAPTYHRLITPLGRARECCF